MDDPHSALHNIMQIELPALIHPPIDSALHGLELICRSCGSFFFFPLIACLIMNPTICPQREEGEREKKCYSAAVIKRQVPFL